MIRARVLFSDEAVRDYLGAIDYISNRLFNPAAAKKLADSLDEVVARLSEFPESSPLCGDEELSRNGVRFAMVQSYIVFYVLNESKDAITLIAFLHPFTDYVNRLLYRIDS